MHVLVVDRDTNSLLVIDPPKNEHGQPILPEGYKHLKVVEVTDIQFNVIKNSVNAQFSVDTDTGTITATEIPPDPPSELEQSGTDLKAQAQAAMDQIDQFLAIQNPTQPQVLAAVKGLAQNQKRLIRYLRNAAG